MVAASWCLAFGPGLILPGTSFDVTGVAATYVAVLMLVLATVVVAVESWSVVDRPTSSDAGSTGTGSGDERLLRLEGFVSV